jgi:hypothetical protein
VDGDVASPISKSILDFLGKQAYSSALPKRRGRGVAGRGDLNQFDFVAGFP